MPPAAARPRRVLLVEDDADLRALLAEVFEGDGWAATEAADGIDGLARAREEAFDVIVLDHRMPGMSGADVATALRVGGDRTPVVLITATTDARQVAERSGLSYWLGKPFDLDTLLRLADRLAPLGP